MKINLFKEKITKKRKNLVICLIILIPIIAIFTTWGLTNSNKEIEAKSMFNLFLIGSFKENQLVFIESKNEPVLFAKNNNSKDEFPSYYFIFDTNKAIYITYLDKTSFETIALALENNEKYQLNGYTKIIPENIKQMALESTKEIYQGEDINKDNFHKYFGNLYVDFAIKNNLGQYQFMIAFVLSILVGIIIFKYFSFYFNLKKQLDLYKEELQLIEKELKKSSLIKDDLASLYLTDHYIISLAKKPVILKYQDLIWVYKHGIKHYGITTNRIIVVYTADKKSYMLTTLNGISKKNISKLDLLVEAIVNKNKTIIKGYTNESRKEIKEKYGIITTLL